MSATFTTADFAGLLTTKILTQLTSENPNASAPDGTVIAQVSATAVDDMFVQIGQRKIRPDTMPSAGGFRNDAFAVTLFYLYSRTPDLLRGLDGSGDPTKHPVFLRYAKAMSNAKAVGRGEADYPELTPRAMTDDGELGTLYGSETMIYGTQDVDKSGPPDPGTEW